MNKYIKQFLEYLEIERNRSQKTIRNYAFYLKRFAEWFGEKKSASSITAEDVRKYRLWLNRLIDIHGEPLKKNTQNYHLIALRSFLKYLAKIDVDTLAPEKIELMKMPDRQVQFLEAEEVERLLAAPLKGSHAAQKAEEGEKGTTMQQRLRDKAILETLFSTGLRVSELANLKKETINLEKDEFTVQGKGEKSRIVFLSEDARSCIKKYLKVRHDMNPYLFVSHDKRSKSVRSGQSSRGDYSDPTADPLSPRTVQRIIKKHAKAAGITKPVTPHTLRHSYATDLLQNGADIRSVQSMLGHASITTTQIYTHITDKQLRKVHKKYHGKKRKKD